MKLLKNKGVVFMKGKIVVAFGGKEVTGTGLFGLGEC